MTVQLSYARLARAFAVVLLLAGIVAMHSAVFVTSAHDTSAHAHGNAAHTAVGPAVEAEPAQSDSTKDHGCGSGGCTERAAVHGCVFILVALAIVLGWMLLTRLTEDADAIRRAGRTWRGRRERPPPWTVLSLSQLAILRI
ncbi:DUF6153 family protein [Nocardia sp. NPDC023988]|uniref:DUF6153 family protein n=1 Tax=unclassified Nocardia TaxID=2637762 RepID=UPI0033F44ED0